MSTRSTLTDRLRSDLGPRVSGELLTDAHSLARYSRAQGWYQIAPIAVLLPRSIDDIQAAVSTCASLNISVIARGGGTGLAGHGIGFGLVIDTSVHLTHVGSSNGESVTVEPGVVLDSLNKHLSTSGRWFPVDPTSAGQCTLGGMIATNAAGWHAPLYGTTRDHVVSLMLVLADGSVVEIGPPNGTPASDRVQRILDTLESRLRPLAVQIREAFPAVAKNSSGYDLPGALASTPLDLRRLLIGSEGTLAIVVGATLSTVPLPRSVGGLLLSGPTYETMLGAVDMLQGLPVAAAELLDPSYATHPGLPEVLTGSDRAVQLYVDFHAGSDEERDALIEEAERRTGSLPRVSRRRVLAPADRDALFSARREASKSINTDRERRKASFIEDGAVPVHRLGEYVGFLQDLLTEKGVHFALYGHAASGNIHCSPFLDIRNLDHYRMIDEIAFRVADKLVSLGGTLSGEHGDGFVRTPFLERLYGPEVFSLFHDVKRTFDPNDILHPGVITGPQNVSIAHDLSFD